MLHEFDQLLAHLNKFFQPRLTWLRSTTPLHFFLFASEIASLMWAHSSSKELRSRNWTSNPMILLLLAWNKDAAYSLYVFEVFILTKHPFPGPFSSVSDNMIAGSILILQCHLVRNTFAQRQRKRIHTSWDVETPPSFTFSSYIEASLHACCGGLKNCQWCLDPKRTILNSSVRRMFFSSVQASWCVLWQTVSSSAFVFF